jgi:hypothetical protein
MVIARQQWTVSKKIEMQVVRALANIFVPVDSSYGEIS